MTVWTEEGREPSSYSVDTLTSAHLEDAEDAHDASAISVVPVGSVAALTVQAAIQELDTEKVSKAGGDTITASGAAVIPLVVKGAASQTANLAEFQNSAGSVKVAVSPAGYLIPTDDFGYLTANNGTGTLPANPVGFFRVMLGGTLRNVPYYAT